MPVSTYEISTSTQPKTDQPPVCTQMDGQDGCVAGTYWPQVTGGPVGKMCVGPMTIMATQTGNVLDAEPKHKFLMQS